MANDSVPEPTPKPDDVFVQAAKLAGYKSTAEWARATLVREASYQIDGRPLIENEDSAKATWERLSRLRERYMVTMGRLYMVRDPTLTVKEAVQMAYDEAIHIEKGEALEEKDDGPAIQAVTLEQVRKFGKS